MARFLYFRTSRSSYEQVAELFDFVWSTSAALWNLRWQVSGLAQALPTATNEILHGRFIAGSGIHSASLRRTCIEMSWNEQQQQFAKFLLIDLFALYEGWLSRTLIGIGQASIEKAIQFPTTLQHGGSMNGLGNALAQISRRRSIMLKDAFYSELIRHPKNSLANLENLLVAYRCFKEYRNALMHNGGLADSKCVAGYQAFARLSSADLGVSEVPNVNQTTLGQPVILSLRGVVGFSDLILRLIATLDAELSCTQGAERELTEQWANHFAAPGRTKKSRYMLSVDADKRATQIRRLVGKLGLPKPIVTGALEAYLKGHRWVFEGIVQAPRK
jgi:hypothetical protein